MRYISKNNTITKDDISEIRLFFDNGNFVTVQDFEIERLDIVFYDRLVWSENEICRVAYNGEIAFNIDDSYSAEDFELCVSDLDNYRKGRKRYIVDRCKSGIVKTVLTTAYNRSWFTLFGNVKIIDRDGGFGIRFSPHLDRHGGTGEHYIDLPDITKSSAGIVALNFENCETVTVYHDEIVDIKLEYSKELYMGCLGEFYRLVTGGYIRVALYDRGDRDGVLWSDKSSKNFIDDLPAIEKRLCGKSGENIHDICNLYISHGGYKEEHLIVDDVEFVPLELCNCGICKKLTDGSILIAFGKNAEETVKAFGN